MRRIQFLKDYGLEQTITGDYEIKTEIKQVYYILPDKTKEKLKYIPLNSKLIKKDGYYMVKYYTHNVWFCKKGFDIYLTSYAEAVANLLESSAVEDYLYGKDYKFY